MKTTRTSIRYFALNRRNYGTVLGSIRMSSRVENKNKRYVKSILEDVAKRGDRALLEYEAKFDGVKMKVKDLKVRRREIDDAYACVSQEQIDAIKFSRRRVEKVERRLLVNLQGSGIKEKGVKIDLRVAPLASVGCYIPGGKAIYPSSVIMTTTPAKVAGVERIVICSPPSKKGSIDPLILVAGDICGVNEFYKIGGAQAIGALAYGTKSIRPVEKIVGPGSKFVADAKMLVLDKVAIDLPAGPTELLILADESADPEIIVSDMISQAEHGEDSISGLITDSRTLARKVQELIPRRLKGIEREEIVMESIRSKGFIVYSSHMDNGINLVNEFAPEHLEIITREPRALAERINNSGIILLGPNTPAAVSDYSLGTNHVLPTGGYAKIYSNLSSLNFVKMFYMAECSLDGLKRISRPIATIANGEGLVNHYLSIEKRLMRE